VFWWDTFYIHTSKSASLGCDLLTPGSPPTRREEKQCQHVSSKEVRDPLKLLNGQCFIRKCWYEIVDTWNWILCQLWPRLTQTILDWAPASSCASTLWQLWPWWSWENPSVLWQLHPVPVQRLRFLQEACGLESKQAAFLARYNLMQHCRWLAYKSWDCNRIYPVL